MRGWGWKWELQAWGFLRCDAGTGSRSGCTLVVGRGRRGRRGGRASTWGVAGRTGRRETPDPPEPLRVIGCQLPTATAIGASTKLFHRVSRRRCRGLAWRRAGWRRGRPDPAEVPSAPSAGLAGATWPRGAGRRGGPPCAHRRRRGVEPVDRVDGREEPCRIDHLDPWADHLGEEREALAPHLGGDVVGLGDVTGQQRRVAVDRPVHAGLGVEQPTGGRRVEDGWAHRDQRPVADVERFAGVDPAHAIEREFHRPMGSFDGEPVGDQGRLRARVEHGRQVADVVVIIVRQEDPAHVGWIDDREGRLGPFGAGRARCRCRRSPARHR